MHTLPALSGSSLMILANRRAGDSWVEGFPGYVDADDQQAAR
jgi:hypothetical protein